ncbi:MAG: hypothetical protein A3G87_05060 [Omnitrophica bacterium RIFCSPLOWO2_12_FULL_50_11]|nr:MAG: hypothetical protein A3G87_05060 [Omnitrophica bacterium RIFCSPLOWO2_12_FULL_50_11]
MTYLGLDFGEKRIGVANSDELALMAHPLPFLEHRSDDQVMGAICRLVEEHGAEKIVVGLPRTMRGEIGLQAKVVLAFVDRLKEKTRCEVVTWDERLTSAEAEKTLLAQDVSRAKRKVRRDALAAQITLQSYLDFMSREKDVKDA